MMAVHSVRAFSVAFHWQSSSTKKNDPNRLNAEAPSADMISNVEPVEDVIR